MGGDDLIVFMAAVVVLLCLSCELWFPPDD